MLQIYELLAHFVHQHLLDAIVTLADFVRRGAADLVHLVDEVVVVEVDRPDVPRGQGPPQPDHEEGPPAQLPFAPLALPSHAPPPGRLLPSGSRGRSASSASVRTRTRYPEPTPRHRSCGIPPGSPRT